MVVNIMKWRPWSFPQSKRFEARIMVHSLKGLQMVADDGNKIKGLKFDGLAGLTAEIRWKGSRSNALGALRNREKRNYTRKERLSADGIVQWDEEFRAVCAFSGSKDGSFEPWEVAFVVFSGMNDRPKNRDLIAGPAAFNLADFAFVALDVKKEVEINVPFAISGAAAECCPSLCLSVCLVELRAALEAPDAVLRPIMPAPLIKKVKPSTLKASLAKVKTFTEFVSGRKSKKASHGEVGSDGKLSTDSEDSMSTFPFDTDSVDGSDGRYSDESRDDDHNIQKSFGYGTLAGVNLASEAFGSRTYRQDEDRLYYSNCRMDVSCLSSQESTFLEAKQSWRQSPKLGILKWRKRKLSFRSPKEKGEPLLKKEYGEEGGDDIDFDRRYLSSSDESAIRTSEDSPASISQFGDDVFAVGSWECEEIISRDGSMKLRTQVFFASIDQRNERAAGESACTTLVAAISDWLHSNHGEIPIKSEFDRLIREGSLQWRKLCNNEEYQVRFPNKHFDLETVLEAKIHPLSVVMEKSYVGFFHPEGPEEESFEFLHGAMSFDSIWDEISRIASECPSDGNPLVYIVSWNDHFFILKVDSDAFYIIDTLGERLFEGCKKAYALKFDRDTVIERMPQENEKIGHCGDKLQQDKEKLATEEAAEPENLAIVEVAEEMLVCRGKNSCKEYIKSFLAAIPIRVLLADIKRGLTASTNTLHQRLQIEFHHTQLSPLPTGQSEAPGEAAAAAAASVPTMVS
ncbi:hypothetical protein Nepgr_009702 [Nepenthes gracilis]|uniref:C2 NT-type domain-containing protein n=1 Tax=Nepenthes gracilis TaxID=150966 RepID=A0AAD3SBS2_NEPGR|nr:hypothetical protein Nepgr_009702 [Nepenthes gracilis]